MVRITSRPGRIYGQRTNLMGLLWGGAGAYTEGAGGLIFGMLIGLHIWGGGLYTGGRINGILRYSRKIFSKNY